MNIRINKINFYFVLERLLNDNYDEDFKYHFLTKDLLTDKIGNEYHHYIENSNNKKMFESTSEITYKVKTISGFKNRKEESGRSINVSNGELRELLLPYVYEYKILEVVPLVIETYLEEYGKDDEINYLNDRDVEVISELVKQYNKKQTEVKVKTLNEIRK